MNISASNIRLELASFRSQSIASLLGSSGNDQDGSTSKSFADILGAKTGTTDTTGRNMALFDPESAYRMMTTINTSELTFKAQYAELSELGKDVEHLEVVGNGLSVVDENSSTAAVTAQLQNFVREYNQWLDDFAPSISDGGILDNVQAAEFSLHALEQNIQNRFFGAKEGLNGMESLGLQVDPLSKRISLNESTLSAALAANHAGVVTTIDEFSASFAKSADLLNKSDNLIARQLDNRSRALDFIASHRSSLETEFGSGDRPTPNAQVAKALTAYQNAFAIGS